MPTLPYDLTLQYISQSYMRLLQTPGGGDVHDGSGSLLFNYQNFVVSTQTSSMAVSTAQSASYAPMPNIGGLVSSSQTGSFATTGSNTFNGTQTITDSLYISNSLNLNDGINIPNKSGSVWLPFAQVNHEFIENVYDINYVGNLTAIGIHTADSINTTNISASNTVQGTLIVPQQIHSSTIYMQQLVITDVTGSAKFVIYYNSDTDTLDTIKI